tara:strand:- start:917 stop:1555 length:639 start_codon:yes stop_codon:yes gene_type:complete
VKKVSSDISLNELDVSEIALWPRQLQLFVVGLVSIILLFSLYWFDIKARQETLARFEQAQLELKADFEKKYMRAVNYPIYVNQKKEVSNRLAQVLEMLPKRAEVPGLVDSLSEKGVSAGLIFRSIRMRAEKKSDFVTELPMEVNVVGSYHELAHFVELLASMSRLVTIHDFTITTLSENELKTYVPVNGNEILRMILTVKTYRYTEPEGQDE